MALVFATRASRLFNVDGVSRRVDVNENGRCAHVAHRQRRRDERVRGDQNLVARTDVEAFQRQPEGVGATGDADAMLRANEAGESALKFADGSPENKIATVERAGHGSVDFVSDREILGLEVDQRNWRHEYSIVARAP